MKNNYEYNGNKYSLKKLDLGVLHKASPLLIKYRELIYKYSSGIDSSKLLYAENEISIIKQAIEEAGKETPGDEKLLNKLALKLKHAEAVLQVPEILLLKKHLAEIEALALFEIITDAEFISGLFSDILVSAEGARVKFDKNSFAEINSLEFIKKVIADFFLSAQLLRVK